MNPVLQSSDDDVIPLTPSIKWVCVAGWGMAVSVCVVQEAVLAGCCSIAVQVSGSSHVDGLVTLWGVCVTGIRLIGLADVGFVPILCLERLIGNIVL